MELSRGVCVLCTTNTKVVFPRQNGNITCLSDLLETFIDIRRFEETSSTMKVCPCCLHDVLLLADYRQNIANFSESIGRCSFCQDNEHLISIADWQHFDSLLRNVNVRKRKTCSICVHCIHFLEVLERMKTNFLKKYPHVKLTENGQAKKKAISAPRSRKIIVNELSDQSVRKTKSPEDLNSALKHLSPLKYSTFNITQFKADAKLVKQVAFVKLSTTNQTARNREKPGPKRSKRSRVTSHNGRNSPSDNSKQSFFKIKLKLNPSKPPQDPRVTSRKVTKPKNKLKRNGPIKKDLFVRVVKMNLKKMKQTTTDSDLEDDEIPVKTPTKASLKLIPGDGLSSSRKRKSVTFAENLNTEISDDEVGRPKRKFDLTPLKSLLKNNSSSKGDVTNHVPGDSSDEELINSLKNLGKDFSDEENDVSESYVKEIQKNNDAIFDSLCITSNVSEKPLHEEITENDRKTKKRKKSLSGSESEGEDGPDRSGKEKEKGMIDNKTVNGHDFDERVSNDDSKEDHDGSNRIEIGGVSQESDNKSEENTDKLKSKSIEPFSSFESASVSLEDDTLITLGEYKKIRSSELTDPLNPDLEESLEAKDPLALDSDEIVGNIEETQADQENLNSSNRLSPVERTDKEDAVEHLEEPTSKSDKVSDVTENNDKQNDNSATTNFLQISEVPVCDSENIVIPCVDNDNTVSDSAC